MKRKTEGRCPYCGGRIEHFPDQDGSCDAQCTRCSWHEHIPGETEISEAKAKNRKRPEKGGA